MEQYEFELTVGDILRLGQCTITVMDIDGAEVTFRLDDEQIEHQLPESRRASRPR